MIKGKKSEGKKIGKKSKKTREIIKKSIDRKNRKSRKKTTKRKKNNKSEKREKYQKKIRK